MPRTCTVCTSGNRDAIDAALVAATPLRDIATRFSVSKSALTRHKHEHLPVLLAAEGQHDEGRATDLMADLRQSIGRLRALSDAIDAWLTDPDDPTRYDIGPRDGDVSVIYTERDAEGKPRRRKAPLSELLARLEDAGLSVYSVEYRHADPRELLGQNARVLTAHLQLFMSIYERLYNAREVERFERAVLDAIGEVAPDVRDRIVENFKRQMPALLAGPHAW